MGRTDAQTWAEIARLNTQARRALDAAWPLIHRLQAAHDTGEQERVPPPVLQAALGAVSWVAMGEPALGDTDDAKALVGDLHELWATLLSYTPGEAADDTGKQTAPCSYTPG